MAAFALSCGPGGARIFVELPADAAPRDGRSSFQPGSGGAGGNPGGPGSDPGTGPMSSPLPAPVDAPTSMPRRDAPSDRTVVEAARPPDVAPDAFPPDAGAPEAPRPDAQPAAGPPAGVNLAMGLVSRWKLDEAGGNAVADSAGGLNNGTVSGAARIEGGFPGARHANPGSLRFDGNDDFVELGTRNLPANNQRQSVVFWVNVAAMPTNGRVCVSLTDGEPDGSRLKIGFRENRVAVFKGGNDDLVTAPPISPGWHHYAYTFDGTTHRLFIDGVQRGTGTVAPDTGAVRNARIGAIFNNAENFQGQIDDVRIYNRPLTALEVGALGDGFQ
jgi:hypothetical protein